MRFLVTGSTGFVGRHVVAAALAAGHDVTAVVRPASPTRALGTVADHPRLRVVRADLRSPDGLEGAVGGIDVVIHLAAAKAGDFSTQFVGTVVATENLLRAMDGAGVGRLVGVSTFSVYDHLALRTGDLLTEQSPIDERPARRDDYARTKLIQEQLYRRFGSSPATRVVILRPGMIYGRDNLWHALLGAELGPRFLRIGSRATLPLTYVENCADAVVRAAELLTSDPCPIDGEIINVVDDDLPTQGAYVEQVSRLIDPPPSLLVPWPVMRAAAAAADRANRVLFGGRARLPGIVVPARLHARFKPLRYSNHRAKELLGWEPRFDLTEALTRSTATPIEANAADG